MQKNLRTIRDIENLQELRVLVRVDFNVPLEDGVVRGDFRIQQALKTILYLKEHNAKVILISHIESSSTLEGVSQYLSESLPHMFLPDFDSEESQDVLSRQEPGEIILIDNIRNYPGEKENDRSFAESLASIADVFVNDAFSVSHRRHASIVGVPEFLPSFAGFLLMEEIEHLEKTFNPEKPLFFILGGAKFETKLPLIEKFLDIADTILIGGALANDIYKARGFEVGNSLVSEGAHVEDVAQNPRIVVPEEVLVDRGGAHAVVNISEVLSGDVIVDASPQWVEGLFESLSTAKTVLWNGPLGRYEGGGDAGTRVLAEKVSSTEAYSIVGGGDTLTAIEEAGLSSSFGFVSTGGGAMLDFLAQGTLPGIEMLCS